MTGSLRDKLIHRMADELDYYRQLLTDNRTELLSQHHYHHERNHFRSR